MNFFHLIKIIDTQLHAINYKPNMNLGSVKYQPIQYISMVQLHLIYIAREILFYCLHQFHIF